MKTSVRTLGIQLWLAGLLLAQLVPSALHAQGGPTLVSSVPANAATGVALDSKISFTFSTAMKAQESITWSGLDTNKLSYAWSADAKTLTCSYNGNLPGGTQVTWLLLSTIPGFIVGFEDSTGTPLSGFPFGSFMTATGGGGTNNCSGISSNGNFTIYNLFKSAMYVQNSAAAPTPDTSSDPFNFGASIALATNRTATGATLTVPGGSPQSMDSFFGHYFIFGSTNDLSKLDALFPAGDYTFTVTGSPNQTVPANLPASAIPNAPHLSNYAADQTINAGADFTLTWDAFVGGRTIDSISVNVYNSSQALVFQITNSAGCPSVLPGTATSVVLPAGTLSSNEAYTAQIMFLNNITVDTNSFPGSAVFVGGQSTTRATIATGTGSITPPPTMVLTNVVWLPAGQLRFEFPAAPGTIYTVEFSSDLGNPLGWTPLPSTNATSSVIQITDTPTPGTPLRFYRARHN
ncbi:MAG TPA: Ig-like domain-containing protein [Candidatus Angelobacter sp.]|nr:Ig-like domain-containing protein [Candidatus Angelobacter sp.]